MTTELKQIIDLIKNEHPNYSDDDIKLAILNHIESNLPEIILKIKLPPKESSIHSFVESLKRARSSVRDFRLTEKNSKQELIHVLKNVREKLLERGETPTASTIAGNIQRIDSASTTLEEHLLATDTHIATLIDKQTMSESKASENLKKLEWLSKDD